MKSTGKAESAFEDSGYTVGEGESLCCSALPPASIAVACCWSLCCSKEKRSRRIVIFYSVWGSQDRAHAKFILEADLLIFLWLCRS